MTEQSATEKYEFSFKVPFEIEITSEKIEDILCSAFEGGSTYWANPMYDIDVIIDDEYLYLDLTGLYSWEIPLYKFGVIYFTELMDKGTEDEQCHFLTYNTLISGAKTMAQKYPRHFRDWINGHDDSITADVYLQCCLFGEIVYG